MNSCKLFSWWDHGRLHETPGGIRLLVGFGFCSLFTPKELARCLEYIQPPSTFKRVAYNILEQPMNRILKSNRSIAKNLAVLFFRALKVIPLFKIILDTWGFSNKNYFFSCGGLPLASASWMEINILVQCFNWSPLLLVMVDSIQTLPDKALHPSITVLVFFPHFLLWTFVIFLTQALHVSLERGWYRNVESTRLYHTKLYTAQNSV